MSARGSFDDARVLIVDDREENISLLERILQRAGYRNVVSTTDPRQAAGLFIEFGPDLVLLDLRMPHLDGFSVMSQLQDLTPPESYLPIVVLTAEDTHEVRQRALAEGATDFLTKPFDPTEVILRIRNVLETRLLHLSVMSQNELLEERVRRRTRELEEAHIETFERLALAAEYRDDDTGQHTRRVGRTSALVGAELGVPKDQVELLERAAGLHDIGKIGVPDNILLAPRKLTSEEFEIVKRHVHIGADILSGSSSPLLRMAEEIARHHHERWDGSGYAGVSGTDIPLTGRIASIADVFDALTHERPYKHAWPVEDAVAEIESQRERQFDPDVVDAFLRVQERATDLPRTGEP